ncbi:MAG: hypothetical protein SGJ10_13640 [Bacteroidota bacterium]|nr:hypothetical protein [Bacteroidota bacterium]
MFKIVIYILILFIASNTYSQTHDSIKYVKVHFMYGSRPLKKFKSTEKHWFGGIKGGHVSMEIDSQVIGFVPSGRVHIFRHRNKKNSAFSVEGIQSWEADTASIKYTSVLIPLAPISYQKIKSIFLNYTDTTPYDYAFFGMRCAAATCEILSQIGITPKGNIYTNFYPQLFRRRLIKLANLKKWKIVKHGGRSTRKWERE